MKTRFLPLLIILCVFSITASAQNEDPENNEDISPEVYQVNGSSLNIYNNNDSINSVGLNSGSAAIGKNNILGLYSVAFGMRNTIGSDTERAFIFGADNTVSSTGSFAAGRFISITGTFPAYVIGEGLGTNYPFSPPSSNCLAVGFQSTKPTLTVTKSNNNYRQGVVDKTGKVAIGDVTPSAKLHIKSDIGEDAGLILEPKQPTSSNTFIRLRDTNHKISVSSAGVMQITAGDNSLNLTGKNFSMSGKRMDVGTATDRRLVLTAQDTTTIYCNANLSHGSLLRFTEGSSYAVRFGNDGLLFRTAENQLPAGSLITNWRDALFLGIDGKITLNGKVGVNTVNTTTDYALAVAGGVLANKVFIQSSADWPDYVFAPDYERMPLGELETYLEKNRHLPDVPSADEMRERGGVDISETQTMLLRKIEEMTLYVIELEKRIAELEGKASGDTLRFTYDACGNRISRTLEFSRMDGDGEGKGGYDPKKQEEWCAELHDNFQGCKAVLSPNPTEGHFTLSLFGEVPTKSTATLLTLTGAVISERTIVNATEEFDLGTQPAGVYLLRLATDKETRTWKIVKRN